MQLLLKDAPGLAGVRGFGWGSWGDGNDAYAQRVRDALRQDADWQKASKKPGFQQGQAYKLLRAIAADISMHCSPSGAVST